MAEIMFVEEKPTLVYFNLSKDSEEKVLAEFKLVVRILTSEGRVVTRYVMDESSLEEYDLNEIVDNPDCVTKLESYHIERLLENFIKTGTGDNGPIWYSICEVVSLLSKHGMWKRNYAFIVDAIIKEIPPSEEAFAGTN